MFIGLLVIDKGKVHTLGGRSPAVHDTLVTIKVLETWNGGFPSALSTSFTENKLRTTIELVLDSTPIVYSCVCV